MTKQKRWLLKNPTYIKDYYMKNRDHLLELRRKRDAKRHDQLLVAAKKYREGKLLWLNTLKQKPCKDCQGVYPSYVMDFDHRNPTTKFQSISHMMTYSKEKILRELKKCDLICANCHRIRTHGGN